MRKLRGSREAVRLAPDQLQNYGNLANHALALQHFDEARQIIHEAEAQKLDDSLLRLSPMPLPFSRRTLGRWRNSNSGLPGSPITRTGTGGGLRYRGLRRSSGEGAGTDQARCGFRHTSGQQRNGAIYLANAALREAAYGNPAEARRSAAEALNLAPTSQGVGSRSRAGICHGGRCGESRVPGSRPGETLPAGHSNAVALAARDPGAIGAG